RSEVAVGDRLAAREEAVQLAELRATERALQIGEPVVVAEVYHLRPQAAVRVARARVAGQPVVAEAAYALGQRGVVGRHHAALARRDVLDGVQAEHGEAGAGPDAAAVHLGAQRGGGVLDQHEPVRARQELPR